MSITVRQYSPEDLANIGTDNWLATLFMNKGTFTAEESKVYLGLVRREYIANIEMDGMINTVTFYATDDKTAIKFITTEYDQKYVKCIDRVTREYTVIYQNY
jgi:hypothetical protein